MAHKLYYMIV